MKPRKFNKLFGWLTAAALLLSPSCTDDNVGGDWDGSDEVTVSFVLAPEAPVGTRATADGDGKPRTEARISGGSKVDMLIYAVYAVDEDDPDHPQYSLLEAFGMKEDDCPFDGIEPGPGQTILKVKEPGEDDVQAFPVTVQLTLKRSVKYQVAFWAQSSQTKAYTTSDLRKVNVNYNIVADEMKEADEGDAETTDIERVKNNDELRDAFCRSVEIVAGETNGATHDVYLYRPLAQINVGTRGYDYEIANRYANNDKKLTYSKIRINRVARYLDVVSDVTYNTTTDGESTEQTLEAFATIDFDYAPLPAYVFMKDNKAPSLPSYSAWDWTYGGDEFTDPHQESKLDPNDYTGEEFLKVRLYSDEERARLLAEASTDDASGDATEDATVQAVPTDVDGDHYLDYSNLNHKNDVEATETFKWLSMCYVLTASKKDEPIVINNVKVWLASDADGTNETQILDINHVPAQRNWRTNIVGNLLTEEQKITVKLDTDFSGEHNGIFEEEGIKWTGPLANGVFYDGKNDVIEISNVEGLLWFQRMVNGDLKVRKWKSNDPPSGKDGIYTFQGINDAPAATFDETNPRNSSYYKKDGINDFEYNGYTKEDINDNELADRILFATKQTDNVWPTLNNFHFSGATVKLMADIDLTGIEWIPIGFDGRIAETVRQDFDHTDPTNRGFYGIFDGNGHTISNLTTMLFGVNVPDGFQQADGRGPYDVPQWFARGLFGMIGEGATVKNVRLLNVNVKGCQCVGAVVGAAQGKNITISNCIVDGGELIVTPMYRGDSNGGASRSFARGVYLGGIVGYFLTNSDTENEISGRVVNCEVKNLFMQGYRRVGGIVGSFVPYYREIGNDKETETTLIGRYQKNNKPIIENNSISNSTILASQFSTFGMPTNKVSNNKPVDNNWVKILESGSMPFGFGWDQSEFNLYAHRFVGGYKEEQFPNNFQSNLTFSEITEAVDRDNGPYRRKATIETLTLERMPMLSAWYADEITLNANFYGNPSAKTRQQVADFNIFSSVGDSLGFLLGKNDQIPTEYTTAPNGNLFKFPMNLPNEVNITWDEGGNVGLYVGSVEVTGNGIGGRTVITPSGVSAEGACALYVCPENKYQYSNDEKYFKGQTVLKDLVVRGTPYAYTGILLAPNKNSKLIKLDNVAIYDVYQTIAMDDWTDCTGDEVWPTSEDVGFNHGNVPLELNNCNLRGYTVPSGQWVSITYTHTTFERGMHTGHGDKEYTCKVETVRKAINNESHSGGPSTITFTDCYFKAPYIIDLTDATLERVKFNDCWASAASVKNEPIKDPYTTFGETTTIEKIEINSDNSGYPTIKYVDRDGSYYDKDLKHYNEDGTEIAD